MAKGDDSRSRNEVKFAQNRGNELNTGVREGVLTPQLDMFRNYYQDAANRGIGERQNILQNMEPVRAGYQNFANTGGYSQGDISNMRARALAPTTGVYDSALRNVERQKSMQGGYSPGFGTLMARMAREKSQSLNDANIGVEASLADMIHQGKLQGLQGLGGVNQQAIGLYGAAPGEANMFGNQVLQGTNQLNESLGQSNQLNQAAAGQQIAASQLPGKFQSAMGNISSGLGVVGQIGGMAYPWLNPMSGGMSGGFNRPLTPQQTFSGGML